MRTAILHYSVPPVVGGVEAVIHAHAEMLLKAGFPVTLIAGVGDPSTLPEQARLILIPEMDTRNPQISQLNHELEKGNLPGDFEALTGRLKDSLERALQSMDSVVVHNVFTKHFNLPFTAALFHLLDEQKIRNCIAWCHDITWTSQHSRPSVHEGYPWDLLRTYRQDVTYVAVSRQRQAELAGLFHCPAERIRVIYDGVDPSELYGFSEEGRSLVERLDLAQADLVLLMPVRITQAKNIELALQVLSVLKSKGVRPKLVVSGPPDPHDSQDMEYYHSLLKLRQDLGLEGEACFVYSAGPQPGDGYTISLALARELYRFSDLLFMPSHREGFGMPILEAGLIGMPVFSTLIPAVEEIAGRDVTWFSPDAPAEEVAGMILDWAMVSPTQRLRQRIRHGFTWQTIFQHDILPLLAGSGSS